MRKLLLISLVLGCTFLAFFAGQSRGSHRAAAPPAAGGRQVLYYVDPMNPAHTSDRPGLAPCGMKMEPVYADTATAIAVGGGMGVMSPGTVKVSPEWQQRLGIRVAKPERKALRRPLRLSGKIAVDEARLYRVNAAMNGWITRTLPFTTGSPVKKDEILAGFYNPDFLAGVQGMLFYLSGRDRTLQMTNSAKPPTNHLAMLDQNLTQNIDTLQNMGMGLSQIERILETRSFDKNVDITSPADGFVLQRNVSEGLRFDKGAELFRIADLSQVWVLVDAPETVAAMLRPGAPARVLLADGRQTLAATATISPALPQFDPASRTLKVRLDTANPDFQLKPDMLVDVEITVALPVALVVPADAILDSGIRKTVFVGRGEGLFEPRAVEVGQRGGDEVQITNGLDPEESIAVRGIFFIDSESRLKLAAAPVQAQAHPATAKDPACGMDVDEAEARSSHLTSQCDGKTYLFCSAACKKRFDAASQLGLSASTRASEQP